MGTTCPSLRGTKTLHLGCRKLYWTTQIETLSLPFLSPVSLSIIRTVRNRNGWPRSRARVPLGTEKLLGEEANLHSACLVFLFLIPCISILSSGLSTVSISVFSLRIIFVADFANIQLKVVSRAICSLKLVS